MISTKNLTKYLNGSSKYYNLFLSSVANKEGELTGETPIPNQALANKNTSLVITPQAANILKQIHALHLKGQELEFCCTGYVNNNGEYVINNIVVPKTSFLTAKEGEVKFNKLYSHIMHKKSHEEVIDTMNNHLRNYEIENNPKAQKALAILGTTRASEKQGNDRYCPTLSDIANSTFPKGVQLKHEIATGTMVITPENGLEVVAIDYSLDKNNLVHSIGISNIPSCTVKNKNYVISISPQDIAGLYVFPDKTM